MRTARKTPPSRDKLLDAALRLMLTKGFTATRVEEICAAAKLTKGSFFHYFKSKEDIGKAVLDRYYSQSEQTILHAPFHKKTDPLDRVYGYIDFAIKMSRNPRASDSCLIGGFTSELSHTYPEFRALCARYFNQWAAAFRKDLEAAKRLHAPRAAFAPEELADYMIALIEGSLLLSKARRDKTVVEKNLNSFQSYLKTLFK